MHSNPRGLVFAGRYRVVRDLKEGLGVTTALAHDEATGASVIVKRAAAQGAGEVARRLSHEALVLGELRSPNLTPLLHFGEEHGLLVVVMPFVEGVTLRQRLEGAPLALTEALAVGTCLFQALETAHAHGVIHRDVKPENVMVGAEVPCERATLIDFGLSRSGRLDASIRDVPVGTVRYLSPEQAGQVRQEMDERSDLYSAGAVLFECLAGRPPFAGESVGEVLRAHLQAPVPELRSLGRTVPRVLEEMLQRLLRKDPRERYQSAEAVVADLTALRSALAAGETDPALTVGGRDRRVSLAQPAFVGRRGELEALERCVARASAKRGGLATVESPSGGGKSRLLDELAARCGPEVLVLRGGGAELVAQRPLEILDGVAQGLVRAATETPGLREAFDRQMDGHGPAAAAALPHLSAVLQVHPTAPLGLEAHAEQRALWALSRLLSAAGELGRPALVLLDDCQWADDLTLRLLGHWQRSASSAADCRVLVVAAFRSEEVAEEHPLRAIEALEKVKLSALGEGELRALAESMAGAVPPQAMQTVIGLSEGSPFLAAAVLQGMVEAGALVPDRAGWQVDPHAMEEVHSSRRAAAFLARRLERLPATPLRLLSVGAVLGSRFELELAAALAGLSAAAAGAALAEARRRHLVWPEPGKMRATFIHDKIREALLRRLGDAERKQLHAAVAERLEAIEPDRAFDLSYHFDAAGEPQRALPYALRAAEETRGRQLLEAAEQQYRIAERGAAGASQDTRLRIAEGLGEVLMLRGKYPESGKHLQVAHQLAQGPLAQARLFGKLGELATKRGDHQAAAEAVGEALRLLRLAVPKRPLGFLLAFVYEAVTQVLHVLFPKLFLARRPLAEAEDALLHARLLIRLSYAYWFVRPGIPNAWAHLRGLNLLERFPPTRELGQAYTNHGMALTIVPILKPALTYAERGLAIRRQLRDAWGEGQSREVQGVVLYVSSKFAQAREVSTKALAELERHGDRWESSQAAFHVAYSAYRLGDLPEAVERSRRLYEDALGIGDHHWAAVALEIWAKASGGQLPAQVVQAELAYVFEDVQTTTEVMQAEAVRLLADGRPADAARLLEEAQRRIDKAGLRTEYVSSVPVFLATALRLELAVVPLHQAARRRALLRELRAMARRALKMARAYQNNLPHALREVGLLAALEGRPGDALRSLDESLAVAERQGARLEHALTQWTRGRVGAAVGWPGAEEDAASGARALAALGADWARFLGRPKRAPAAVPEAPVTLSLADRFVGVLEVGRELASALTHEAVLGAVQKAALTLLRGERCWVLGVDDKGELSRAELEGREGYSRSVVERALSSGQTVVVAEGLAAEGDSALLSGVRSCLCAPFRVRGRVAGCFVVTHRQLGGLFGADEERLSDFIATLAGAALENAEGFAKLQAFSRTLEGEVEKRTAELAQSNGELAQSLWELRRAQGELLRTERIAAVAKLAGGVAHELNNPLAFVSANLRTLQEGAASGSVEFLGELPEVVADCLVGLRRMTDLVATFRRLADPMDTVGRQRLCLRDEVEGAIASLRQSQGALRREIVSDTAPQLEVVIAPEDLRTAITNLLLYLLAEGSGARAGAAALPVRIEAVLTAGKVSLSLVDPTLELSPEALGGLFDPRISQAGPRMRLDVDLALAHQLLRRNDAELTVEAVGDGGGTVFRCVFARPPQL